jgi:hypothetical protein
MSKNNIGGIFAIMKEIADELGWNYSHGNLSEVGFRAVQVYPLQHVTIQSITIAEQISTVTLNIVIADIVNYLKGENEQLNQVNLYSQIGYTENSNYAHILNELYVRFSLKLREKMLQYNEDWRVTLPITATPFIEADKDVLAGHTISIVAEIKSPFVIDCYDEV